MNTNPFAKIDSSSDNIPFLDYRQPSLHNNDVEIGTVHTVYCTHMKKKP